MLAVIDVRFHMRVRGIARVRSSNVHFWECLKALLKPLFSFNVVFVSSPKHHKALPAAHIERKKNKKSRQHKHKVSNSGKMKNEITFGK